MDLQNESPPCSTPNPSFPASEIASHKRKAGRKKFQETRHPFFRGVRRRNGNRWVCEVREPNKKSRIWLGTYPNPEMAARAHDVAALSLRGSSAALNFPDSAELLPAATSSSAKDIRAAATKAACAFRPTGSSFSSHDHQNITSRCSLEDEENSNIQLGDEFLDEEALYNMPALLDHMAEGLLLSPPSVRRSLDLDLNDDFTCQIDLTLWRDD